MLEGFDPKVRYFMYDERTGRGGGHGSIRLSVWALQQAELHKKSSGLTMVPIDDLDLFVKVRDKGVENHRYENGQWIELPPEQQNLTPKVIVITDDTLEAILMEQRRGTALMTEMIRLMRVGSGLPE